MQNYILVKIAPFEKTYIASHITPAEQYTNDCISKEKIFSEFVNNTLEIIIRRRKFNVPIKIVPLTFTTFENWRGHKDVIETDNKAIKVISVVAACWIVKMYGKTKEPNSGEKCRII